MIDQWIKTDLAPIWEQHPVAVLCDPTGEAEFLLNGLTGVTVHRPADELSELKAKYAIEKGRGNEPKVLIYSRQPRNGLRFLREYCETCGCVEITRLSGYVKAKVHATLNLHLNLPDSDLLTAARLSVGKGREYWMDICHKGAGEIFDLAKELLPFLHAPEEFDRNRYDADIRNTFYRKVCGLIGKPYVKKPPMTLAKEVVDTMLRGLLTGNLPPALSQVYESWLDSVSYRESFHEYLDAFSVPASVDPTAVALNHPFRQLDEQWLAALAEAVDEPTQLQQWLPRIRKRAASSQARTVGISFWEDVLTLVDFDPQNISYLSSLTECIAFYTEHIAPLDTAIRNLYAALLTRPELLGPWQTLYRDHVNVFLARWFAFFKDYHSNQQGLLQRILNENAALGTGKVAIIVGDGVAFEVACIVARKVGPRFKLSRDIILADLPSETENNMSRIYLDNGLIEKIQSNREKYLREQNPDKTIDFLRLDDVGDAPLPGHFLVAAYKEIDDMGEKLQQKALKHFDTVIDFLAGKVRQLLGNGYGKVYLIADHGFVLTGILSESDKIMGSTPGSSHTAERYIESDQRLSGMGDLVEEERTSGARRYLYFAKNLNPFKTPGVYGYAHGGATPQEVITPFFCWQPNGGTVTGLAVAIANKAALNGVSGNLFAVKVSAGVTPREDLFSRERRVYLLFFAEGRQVNKSDIFTVAANSAVQKEFAFDGHPQLELQLLDAESRELLDSACVLQKQTRDLGGLL